MIFTHAAFPCHPLTHLINGRITYSPASNDPLILESGTVATHTCSHGYALVGESERTCSNGRWSGTESYCTGMIHIV